MEVIFKSAVEPCKKVCCECSKDVSEAPWSEIEVGFICSECSENPVKLSKCHNCKKRVPDYLLSFWQKNEKLYCESCFEIVKE